MYLLSPLLSRLDLDALLSRSFRAAFARGGFAFAANSPHEPEYYNPFMEVFGAAHIYVFLPYSTSSILPMIVLSYHKHITLAGLQLPEQLPSIASPPCQRHDWNLHLLLRNPSPRLVCPSSWFGQRRAATPALWPFSMPVSRLAMGSSKWQGMARVFPLLPPSILAKSAADEFQLYSIGVFPSIYI